MANLAKKMMQKKPEKSQKPWQMVLIWEYAVRAFQWIPTWQGLDGFQKSSCLALDESSFRVGKVNYVPFTTALSQLSLICMEESEMMNELPNLKVHFILPYIQFLFSLISCVA